MPRFLIITPSDDIRWTDNALFAEDAGARGFDIVIDTQELRATFDGVSEQVTEITRAEWEASDE